MKKDKYLIQIRVLTDDACILVANVEVPEHLRAKREALAIMHLCLGYAQSKIKEMYGGG